MANRKLPAVFKKQLTLVKKPVVVVIVSTSVALSGLYGLTKIFRYFEPPKPIPYIDRFRDGEGIPHIVKPQYEPKLTEILREAQSKIEQTATLGVPDLCRAALFCDAQQLYQHARRLIDAVQPCDVDCFRVRADLEARASYIKVKIDELGKESRTWRHTGTVVSIAECVKNQNTCDCIAPVAKSNCR